MQEIDAGSDRAFTLPDEQRLGYAEHGDEHGRALLFFYGTPGCRLHDFASWVPLRLLCRGAAPPAAVEASTVMHTCE
jgi:hypothetical protein